MQKELEDLNKVINELVAENDDLIDACEDYLEAFTIACDLLNDLCPVGEDWMNIIVADIKEAHKKCLS